MSTFFYIELNAILTIMLLIMYFSVSGKSMAYDTFDQRLFKILLLITVVTLIFDSGMWYIDGKTFSGAKTINYIMTVSYLCLSPLICLCWIMYGDYKINGDKKKLFKRIYLYVIPCILNMSFVIASLYTEWIFYIDKFNIYHRGPLIWITPFASYSYFIIMTVVMVKKSRKTMRIFEKEIYYYFIIFPLAPIVGSIIQSFYYGMSTIGAGFLISFFMIFINIQNNRIYTDSLTGVYNREYFEIQSESAINSITNKKMLFLLMIDMDNLKHINDTYGHLQGDISLVNLANILKSACGRKYNIYRFGGDEFVVLGNCNKVSDMEKLISDIETGITDINSNKGSEESDFVLSCSIGSAVYNGKGDIHEMIRCADKEMYQKKCKRKQQS